MRKRWLVVAVMFLAACAPMLTRGAFFAPAVGGSNDEVPLAQQVLFTATLEPSATPDITEETTATRVAFPSTTPTSTLLPPLELPTLPVVVPALRAWLGVPSLPLFDEGIPLYFSVLYDPEVWAFTKDQFGFDVLAHRAIPYCTIGVAISGGLSPGWTAEQDAKMVGPVYYQMQRISLTRELKYINYYGGRGKQPDTAFSVAFEQDVEACIADAEIVLATLNMVTTPPTATPTATTDPTLIAPETSPTPDPLLVTPEATSTP